MIDIAIWLVQAGFFLQISFWSGYMLVEDLDHWVGPKSRQ